MRPASPEAAQAQPADDAKVHGTALAGGLALVGDGLRLPFADGSFDRVLTGHFYGHLPEDERDAFLGEARRVAAELVVIALRAAPGSSPSSGRSAS